MVIHNPPNPYTILMCSAINTFKWSTKLVEFCSTTTPTRRSTCSALAAVFHHMLKEQRTASLWTVISSIQELMGWRMSSSTTSITLPILIYTVPPTSARFLTQSITFVKRILEITIIRSFKFCSSLLMAWSTICAKRSIKSSEAQTTHLQLSL